MTKFEEEIEIAIIDSQYGDYDSGDMAKAAAEVAKKWMHAAWEGAVQIRVYKGDRYTITFEEWLKENGIIEDPEIQKRRSAALLKHIQGCKENGLPGFYRNED